jgi:hypothetical protein
MTSEEFERGYAERSGMTVEALRAAGRVVRRCDCGDALCLGWVSVSQEAATDYEPGGIYFREDRDE